MYIASSSVNLFDFGTVWYTGIAERQTLVEIV